MRQIHDWYGGKLWLFDLVGTAKGDRLVEVMTYASKRYGVTVFVVDSLSKCGISEDDYRGQKAFVEQLSDFTKKTESHVHLVAHPRKGEDENQAPGKLDIKGTGAITDMADNVFTVWRNKRKTEKIADMERKGEEIPDELKDKPDCLITCSKQRVIGKEKSGFISIRGAINTWTIQGTGPKVC